MIRIATLKKKPLWDGWLYHINTVPCNLIMTHIETTWNPATRSLKSCLNPRPQHISLRSFDANTSCAVVSLALVKQMPIKQPCGSFAVGRTEVGLWGSSTWVQVVSCCLLESRMCKGYLSCFFLHLVIGNLFNSINSRRWSMIRHWASKNLCICEWIDVLVAICSFLLPSWDMCGG